MDSKEKFKKAFAEGDGKGMASAIGTMFNTFGSPKMDGFSDEEMNGIRLCGYLTLFSLCDWWERSGLNGWDDRKKASAVFAYRNKDLLQEQFSSLTGLPAFPEAEQRGYELGQRMRAMPDSPYSKAGYGWMPPFVTEMCTEHSTLQQSFVRWFTKEILFRDYPEGIFEGNNDMGTVSFPFI